MKKDKLKKAWKKEEKAAFVGWNFYRLAGRWKDEELPWDYKEILLRYLKSTDMLLDMGTGGGEFLLTLGHPYYLLSVTEGYKPNFDLCIRNLAGLGVDVKFVESDNKLKFSDSTFEIVINRHESYDPQEVKRVLKPGGMFITQQVGGRNDAALSKRLVGDKRQIDDAWDLEHAAASLKRQGFEILNKKEVFPKLKFFEVGALVYFAKVIEWEFPGFSVDSCYDKLLELHNECREKGYIECTEHRFLIECKKPLKE